MRAGLLARTAVTNLAGIDQLALVQLVQQRSEVFRRSGIDADSPRRLGAVQRLAAGELRINTRNRLRAAAKAGEISQADAHRRSGYSVAGTDPRDLQSNGY